MRQIKSRWPYCYGHNPVISLSSHCCFSQFPKLHKYFTSQRHFPANVNSTSPLPNNIGNPHSILYLFHSRPEPSFSKSAPLHPRRCQTKQVKASKMDAGASSKKAQLELSLEPNRSQQPRADAATYPGFPGVGVHARSRSPQPEQEVNSRLSAVLVPAVERGNDIKIGKYE